MRYQNLVLLAFFVPVFARAQVMPDSKPDFDPAAVRLLGEMVKAYRGLHSLEQETTYANNSGSAELARLLRSRLVVDRPNRLLFETYQISPGQPEPVVSRFLCDGKSFYIYRQQMGAYSKGKAPKDLKGFQMISISLEMALLTGLDPIDPMLKQARAVRIEEPVVMDGVKTDVILLDMGSDSRSGETRLYLGDKDHLIRRFTFESKIQTPPQSRPEQPAAPNDSPIPVRYGYDNHVVAGKPVAKELFTWIPPSGAMIYDPKSDKYLNPAGSQLPNGAPAPGQGKGTKQGKLIPYQDYVKQQKKKQPPR